MKPVIITTKVLIGVAILLCAALFLVKIPRHHSLIKPPVKSPEINVISATSTPEIAINEYWNYAQFPNRHMYINNTDKDVVYVLDDAGKKVGEFWAKDFGFPGYFEVRQYKDAAGPIVVLSSATETHDGLMLAIDPITPAVLWHKKVSGSFDMPQVRVLKDGSILLENYGKDPGVNIANINIRTGISKWEISDPNYFGIYFNDYEMPPNQMHVFSGGVGQGNWQFTYVLDTEIGKIISEFASLSSLSDGHANADPTKDLVWHPTEKRIDFVERKTNSVYWSATKGNALYDLLSTNGPGNTQISIFPNIITAIHHENNKTTLNVFSNTSVKWLWARNFGSGGNDLSYIDSYKNFIITTEQKPSKCASICEQNICQGFICLDVPPSNSCLACRADEKKEFDHSDYGYVAYRQDTGEIVWSYFTMLDAVDFDWTNGIVRISKQGVGNEAMAKTLDLNTGALIK